MLDRTHVYLIVRRRDLSLRSSIVYLFKKNDFPPPPNALITAISVEYSPLDYVNIVQRVTQQALSEFLS